MVSSELGGPAPRESRKHGLDDDEFGQLDALGLVARKQVRIQHLVTDDGQKY